MLFQLAFRNFKKQLKSYLFYFFCMVMAVTTFYCFSALTYDQELVMQVSQDVRMEQMLNLGQFAVIAILLFFMLSANRFFLERRGEEIGIYQLLGMRKGKILMLFFAETLFLGACSLIAGIFLGVIFSKLFSMILVKAMALKIASEFFISWRSISLTSYIMLLALLVVSARTTWLIYLPKGTELFRKEELEGQKFRPQFFGKFFGLLGLLLLILGYISVACSKQLIDFLADNIGGVEAYLLSMLIPFGLCLVGTYLFFGWSLKLVLAWIEGWRKYNDRDLHAVMLGNLKANISRNWRTSAAISIILSLAILVISLAVSLFSVSQENVLHDNPVSFQMAEEEYPAFNSLLTDNGSKLKEERTLTFKAVGSYLSYTLAGEAFAPGIELVDLMPLSSYKAYREINPHLPKVVLSDTNTTVVFDQMENAFQEIIFFDSAIQIPGATLQVISTHPDYLGAASLRYSGITLVVTDEVFARTAGVSYSIKAVNVAVTDNDALEEAIGKKISTSWISPVSYDYTWNDGKLQGSIQSTSETQEYTQYRLNFSSQYLSWRLARRQTGLVVYISAFIGLIALITTASILSLRQLSEIVSGRKDYQLLHVIGVPRKKMLKLLYQENAWIFLPVVAISVLNALFGIYYLTQYISNVNFWLPNVFLGILLLIYSIFYLLTVLFYRRAVLPR